MFSAFLQIVSFLIANRDEITKLVHALQDLFGPGTGATKGEAFKATLTAMMGATDVIEQGWPLAQPVVNAFVALVKGKTAAQ